MSFTEPFASFVTPVYNGEAYLGECIESVLAQSYRNWEYVLVDNCSTDRTREIVEKYRKKDSRIKVFRTTELLPVLENHNFALSKLDPESKYCKIIHADDWLFPECLEKMLKVALAYPTIGVVGSFGLVGRRVRCDGLSYPSHQVPGNEICRRTLLGQIYPFWSPSSTLLRTDLVREKDPFYQPKSLHGDVETMYEILQQCDFGFVHQVLVYSREHQDSETARSAQPLNTIIWSNLDLLVRYGPIFLAEQEYATKLKQYLNKYYQFLADSLFEGRNKAFWNYHRAGLGKVGYPLRAHRLAAAAIGAVFCRTRPTIKKILRSLNIR